MAKMDAYLHFEGNCKEAMTFYKGALGGELNLMTVGDSPMGKQAPAADQKKIMHAMLKNGDIGIMGSDNMGGNPVKVGTNISLSLSCADKKELDGIYARLSAGGKATHPPKDEFFGYFGDLTDTASPGCWSTRRRGPSRLSRSAGGGRPRAMVHRARAPRGLCTGPRPRQPVRPQGPQTLSRYACRTWWSVSVRVPNAIPKTQDSPSRRMCITTPSVFRM